MNNLDIRQAIAKKRLKNYEVAQALNINECTLSRWLRVEMSTERKRQVMKAIRSIK